MNRQIASSHLLRDSLFAKCCQMSTGGRGNRSLSSLSMLALSFPLSFLLTLTSCSQDADALPNPMSLTFEVEELSDDVTRTAYLTPEGSTGQ